MSRQTSAYTYSPGPCASYLLGTMSPRPLVFATISCGLSLHGRTGLLHSRWFERWRIFAHIFNHCDVCDQKIKNCHKIIFLSWNCDKKDRRLNEENSSEKSSFLFRKYFKNRVLTNVYTVPVANPKHLLHSIPAQNILYYDVCDVNMSLDIQEWGYYYWCRSGDDKLIILAAKLHLPAEWCVVFCRSIQQQTSSTWNLCDVGWKLYSIWHYLTIRNIHVGK